VKIKSNQIDYLVYVNEIALLVGLTLLVIGNFLGGVWANESWGRYWGWDPKETWTFVAIVSYALITHLRFIPKFYSKLNFSLSSVLGYGTILMTYFGVNFYLAGLHSYAKGDPVPIPTWIYVVLLSIVVLYLLALKNRNKIIKESK
jgi:ABC-type transport system involved in cytochrome c biogenesis permease subunit